MTNNKNKVKCDYCNKNKEATCILEYEGRHSCVDCAVSLIYYMAERGRLILEEQETGKTLIKF